MSIQSMTGYGSASFSVEGQRYRVEIKSVNHRNLSARLRFPPELTPAEGLANKLVADALGRGAVDLTVARDGGETSQVEVVVDTAGVQAIMGALQQLARTLGAPAPGIEVALRAGDFIDVRRRRASDEAVIAAVREGIGAALAQLVEMRLTEGDQLAGDLAARLARIEALLEQLEGVAPRVQQHYQERLEKRLAEAEHRLGVELDAGRLATELVVYADKSDVTEELVRARAHVAHFRELIARGDDEAGKRMDFLAQELFREFNTVGSKCRDAGMAEAVVDGKVELEKIREQIQNIA
jgi:uncharacterized protein (TIGR00255 family)